MNQNGITVISVNWYSSEHLERLAQNLLSKAEISGNIRFLIIDNTCGKDSQLKRALNDIPAIKIVQHHPNSRQRSIAHASALDVALQLVETEYSLVIDPDVHVFHKGWDRFCVAEINSGNIAVGAPYPDWKLGKIHYAPSVVFFFGKTDWFISVKRGWYPFPSPVRWLWNFFVRKFIRLFGLATRKRLEKNGFIRSLTGFLEQLTGITSPDTGWRLSKTSVQGEAESTIFKTLFSREITEEDNYLFRLAVNFELFYFNGMPFMTHMYSSGISYYRTDESGNLEAWLSAIDDIEELIR